MLQKPLRLLLTLALTFGVTASVFAQDAGPDSPSEEEVTRSVYLPLVLIAQQNTAAETEVLTEAEGQEAEAAGSKDSCAKSNNGNRSSKDSNDDDLNVVGLTADQRLICFESDKAKKAKDIGLITGLTIDTSLVGIDFRPANGLLYGLGNAGGVYTLNLTTAQVTLSSRLTETLVGSFFGVDFNPVVDRLRITSDTGQNLRVNVDTGATIIDTALSYPAPGANPATGIAGAAYTNNDADPNTATTLYDIDSTLDQVAIQSPANSGLLAATGKLTVDTSTAIGFDIYSTVRNGATENVSGFASLVVGGQSNFYGINLITGKATLFGTFKASNQVIGIAIPLNQ